MQPNPLLGNLPPPMPEELFETLAANRHVRIERIVSWGQTTAADAWYDQTWAEWVALLQGQARLALEDQPTVTLRAGDSLLIPARCRHRVEWTSTRPPAVWLAVHLLDD